MISDFENVARGYNNLGNIFWYQRRFDEALENYERALSIALSAEKLLQAADSYNNIGLVYSIWQNHDRARESFSHSLALLEGTDRNKLEGDCFMNMALTYLHENSLNRALEQSHKAYRCYSQIEERRGMGLSLSLAGRINLLKGEFRKSGALLHQALKLLEEVREYRRVVPARILSMTFKLQTGDFTGAVEDLHKSLQEAHELDTDDLEILALIRQLRLHCYTGKRDELNSALQSLYPDHAAKLSEDNTLELLQLMCLYSLESDRKIMEETYGNLFREYVERAHLNRNKRHLAWGFYYASVADFQEEKDFDEKIDKSFNLVTEIEDTSLRTHLKLFELEISLKKDTIDRESILHLQATLKEITRDAEERGDWQALLQAYRIRIMILSRSGLTTQPGNIDQEIIYFIERSVRTLPVIKDRSGFRKFLTKKIGIVEYSEDDIREIPQPVELSYPGDEPSISVMVGENARAVNSQEEVITDSKQITEENQDLSAMRTEISSLKQQLEKYRTEFEVQDSLQHLVFRSSGMRKIVQSFTPWKEDQSNILICGEKGSGKKFLASFIHDNFIGNQDSMRIFDCAVTSWEMISVTLSGKDFLNNAHGTDADLHTAPGTTIFFQELDQLKVEIQDRMVKLIRAKLDEGRRLPVFISSISIPPQTVMQKGKLLSNLLRYLGKFRMNVPPLRERKEDFLELLNIMLAEESQKTGRDILNPSIEAVTILRDYSWPGNVYQLRLFIRDLYNLKKDDTITAEDIPDSFRSLYAVTCDNLPDTFQALKHVKTNFIHRMDYFFFLNALQKYHGNLDRISQITGLSTKRLVRLLEKLNLDSEHFS